MIKSKGRTVRDSETFFAFEGDEILTFSTDLDGIQKRQKFDGFPVTGKKDEYKLCSLEKVVIVVQMGVDLFPVGCQLVDKETLKVVDDHHDLLILQDIFTNFGREEYKLRSIVCNEESPMLLICLEKRETLFVAKFDMNNGYERMEPHLLAFKDKRIIPSSHFLYGVMGFGTFGLVKASTDFLYVSLITGEVIGSGKSDCPQYWHDRREPEMLCQLTNDNYQRVTLPGLPFFCGNFLEHLQPKLHVLATRSIETIRKHGLIRSFLDGKDP